MHGLLSHDAHLLKIKISVWIIPVTKYHIRAGNTRHTYNKKTLSKEMARTFGNNVEGPNREAALLRRTIRKSRKL
jgi:hypothetical protein